MKKILIICTGNSCRSQMAHGILSAISKDIQIYSAGTHPEPVNQHAIKVMSEVNIDISKYSSNHIDEYVNLDFDLALTLCDNAKKKCSFLSQTKSLVHMSFKDPAVAKGTYIEIMNQYREVRELLEKYIKGSLLIKLFSNN
ncbi:MAG: arsenate reductase ArsC [Flavobacteriales bacterium]